MTIKFHCKKSTRDLLLLTCCLGWLNVGFAQAPVYQNVQGVDRKFTIQSTVDLQTEHAMVGPWSYTIALTDSPQNEGCVLEGVEGGGLHRMITPNSNLELRVHTNHHPHHVERCELSIEVHPQAGWITDYKVTDTRRSSNKTPFISGTLGTGETKSTIRFWIYWVRSLDPVAVEFIHRIPNADWTNPTLVDFEAEGLSGATAEDFMCSADHSDSFDVANLDIETIVFRSETTNGFPEGLQQSVPQTYSWWLNATDDTIPYCFVEASPGVYERSGTLSLAPGDEAPLAIKRPISTPLFHGCEFNIEHLGTTPVETQISHSEWLYLLRSSAVSGYRRYVFQVFPGHVENTGDDTTFTRTLSPVDPQASDSRLGLQVSAERFPVLDPSASGVWHVDNSGDDTTFTHTVSPVDPQATGTKIGLQVSDEGFPVLDPSAPGVWNVSLVPETVGCTQQASVSVGLTEAADFSQVRRVSAEGARCVYRVDVADQVVIGTLFHDSGQSSPGPRFVLPDVDPIGDGPLTLSAELLDARDALLQVQGRVFTPESTLLPSGWPVILESGCASQANIISTVSRLVDVSNPWDRWVNAKLAVKLTEDNRFLIAPKGDWSQAWVEDTLKYHTYTWRGDRWWGTPRFARIVDGQFEVWDHRTPPTRSRFLRYLENWSLPSEKRRFDDSYTIELVNTLVPGQYTLRAHSDYDWYTVRELTLPADGGDLFIPVPVAVSTGETCGYRLHIQTPQNWQVLTSPQDQTFDHVVDIPAGALHAGAVYPLDVALFDTYFNDDAAQFVNIDWGGVDMNRFLKDLACEEMPHYHQQSLLVPAGAQGRYRSRQPCGALADSCRSYRYRNGDTINGVYRIDPFGDGQGFDVVCSQSEQDTPQQAPSARGLPVPLGWEHRVSADEPQSCVTTGPGRIDCFVRGNDNALYQLTRENGLWGAWQSLGGEMVDAPSCVSMHSNRIDCFVRGHTNVLYQRSYRDGGWENWRSLGGMLTSAPSCVSMSPGRIDCIVRGGSNRGYQKTFKNGSWGNWKLLHRSRLLSSAPSCLSLHPGRIYCYYRARDYVNGGHSMHQWAIQDAWRTPSWTQHTGRNLADGPRCKSTKTGRIDCTVKDEDGHMYRRSIHQNGAAWGAWQRL